MIYLISLSLNFLIYEMVIMIRLKSRKLNEIMVVKTTWHSAKNWVNLSFKNSFLFCHYHLSETDV